MAKDLICTTLDNRIQGSEAELLSKYLKNEDILSLNNPEVLEEVLKNVENSVFPETRYTRSLLNILVSIFSVLLSYFKGLIEVLCGFVGKFFNHASKQFERIIIGSKGFAGKFLHSVLFIVLPGKLLLKIRVLTVMPVFFIVLFLFSPTNKIIKLKITNLPQCIETARGTINLNDIENVAMHRSPTHLEGSSSLDNLMAANKRESQITKTLSAYKSTANKGNTNSGNLSVAINPQTSLPASGGKDTKIVQSIPSNDKSAAIHQNSISRSAKERMELPEVIKNHKKKLVLRATAYDLSVKSCNKRPGQRGYGITKSGARATVGRTIAVDPLVIPLYSKVYISFPEAYKHMNGIYYAEDTGSLIKGNKIDVFLGEDKPGEKTIHKLAKNFGIQNVEVYIF